MVYQRENHIATQMWIRLGIYQSNMHVDTLGHFLAPCMWIPFDILKSNMHVDTRGHLKATCMWIPLDISKATRMWIHLNILKHQACEYAGISRNLREWRTIHRNIAKYARVVHNL